MTFTSFYIVPGICWKISGLFPVSLVLSLSGKERRRVIFKEIEREGMLAKQEQRSKERER